MSVQEVESRYMYWEYDFNLKKKDIDWLIEQAKKVKRYEDIIHAIANIDTIFMLPDGSDRDWNDKEALEEIEKLVMPVWNEYCEEKRKEAEKMLKEYSL